MSSQLQLAPRATPASLNVASYLPQMAQAQPDALAVAVANGPGGYQRLTCDELNRRSDRIAHGLEKIGIGRGVRVVLMVKPSPEFFALTFALFKVGAVVVLVDPGMGVKKLGICLGEAEPAAFIGIPKAHVARIVLGWSRRTLETLVTVGTRLFWGGHTLAALEAGAPDTPYPMADVGADQTAAILFTSGSTGVPKGAVYTHGIFSAQVRLLQATYGIEPGELDLSTFPLFALFGPALGMASVVPNMDASRPAAADPKDLVQAMVDFSCTNMFASPALIEKVGRYCTDRGIALPTLRRAISAGAPASIPAIERFAALLPEGAEVFTPYGATESLPVASIGSEYLVNHTRRQTDSGAGVCVGPIVDEMEAAIIPISDDPITTWDESLRLGPGEIGEITVRGPVVTSSYFNRARSTELAKIPDPKTGAVWHRMGDVGTFDARGYLWMCGRKSHRVQTAAGVMFTIPCEAVFNTHPDVFRSALVGVPRDGSTVPVICIELEKGRNASPQLTEDILALGQAHAHTRPITALLYHRSFPVDVRHNAKIFREELTVWASKRLP